MTHSLLRPKTAVPIHEEARDQWFYHGTSTESSAQAILAQGIQPREISMPAKAKSREHLAPAQGRVYITTDLGYAAIYALGGSFFGSTPPESALKGRGGEDSPYGYIFGLRGEDLKGDVVPDEDSIGEMLSDAMSLDTYKRELQRFKTTTPKPSDEFLQRHADRLQHYADKPINQPEASRVRWNLLNLADQVLTARQREKVLMHFIDGQAVVGKKIQKRLLPADIKWMLEHGAHTAHLGAAHPKKAWRFLKVDAAKTKAEDVLSICEEIPLPDPALEKTATQQSYGLLEEAAEDARNKVFGAGPARNGDCEPTSDALYDILKAQGLNPSIAYGFYRNIHHSWVQIGDVYIDPTHDQFGAPDIRVGKITDRAYKRDYELSGRRVYAAQKQAVADYNRDAWKSERDQYSGAWSPEESQDQTKQRIYKGDEWEQSLLAALSTGELKPEDCKQKRIGPGGLKPTDFKPLPSKLYHATTAASKVKSSGLLSRWELALGRGAGLGGGDDKSISFTDDLKVGEDILDALRIARAVAGGQITIQKMVEMAKAGTGAQQPFYDDFLKFLKTTIGGDELYQEAFLRDATVERGQMGSPPKGEGWKPREDQYHWTGGDGVERYTIFERPWSDADRKEHTWQAMSRFLSAREEAGGPINPLFFLTDSDALAHIPESEIALLEFRPAPGARGTQVSALGEWRTYSGDAVQFVREVKPENKQAARGLGEVFAIAMTETLPLTPEKFEFHNDRENPKVKALTNALKAGEELPPILVVQMRNGKYHLLDGNHRFQAALNAGKTEIEAYVVTWKDLKKVLDAYFDGRLPLEASELDDYILLNENNLEPYSKRAAFKLAVKINVPESEHEHFWVEPPAGHEEFWAFRFPPKAKPGDPVIFHMNKKPVAEAVVSRIEKPGQHSCEQTGRFGNRWKVYWTPESFRKLESSPKSAHLASIKLSMYFPNVDDRPGKRASDNQEIPKAVFLDALKRLNDLLKGLGQSMTFLCVGGGAMMLAYGAREKTQDLDGILKPDNSQQRALLQDLAEQVSEEFTEAGKFHLPSDWINMQVRPIMQEQGYNPSDFSPSPEFSWSNLTLMFASPEYLLAMKCQALREGKKDWRDVASLAKILNVRTIEGLRAAVEPYMNWDYLGNNEVPLLKLAIAWAFPSETQYDAYRLRALERYRQTKSPR